MNKVTKLTVHYPIGFEPDFINPEKYESNRFLIGKKGTNPLVVVAMNPSSAQNNYSDRTVNRIINVSQKLKYDGWTVINTYPERATDAVNLDELDQDLIDKNVQIAYDYLLENHIQEVWGAWGDLKFNALIKGRDALLTMFNQEKIRIFHFAELTKAGNPRHPLYLKVQLENKRYF